MDTITPADFQRIKCGMFTMNILTVIVCFSILWSSLVILLASQDPDEEQSKGCGHPKCRCQQGMFCLCMEGMCRCKKMCQHKMQTLMYLKSLEKEQGPVEQGSVETIPEDLESFSNVSKDFERREYKTRKFEMTGQDNQDGTAKNLLFGEGEFIFTPDTVHVFIMADMYVIGGNLYSAKDKGEVTSLHYNVYVGDAKKTLKFKLGELKRSLDGRYKLQLKSKLVKFMKMLDENSYICVRLEDDKETIRQTLLEGFF